jgi:hypothetical protein
MNLQIGDEVSIFIKASDLSIGEIINDWYNKRYWVWAIFTLI